jgi:hypothetical protein
MQHTTVDATEFVPTSDTLTDQSEVWSVKVKAGASKREVMELHCEDQEHAEALADMLRRCVEITVDLKELD